MIAAIPKPENRPYAAYGAALDLWSDRSPEILLSGPAGTGKSRACLEKLWAAVNRWPNTRALICRKTRSSLTETGLVTFEDKVVPANHACLQGAGRMSRQSYLLANGSEIIVRGLDDMTKIMSGEYDLIYLQEAIEASEDDLEKLTTRLRNNVMPFQQIIMDTNPEGPNHWLKLRCNKGLTKLYDSRHEDNPTLFDPSRRVMTPFGMQYLAVLDRLTGARKDRLRYGKWVQAEGVVYEGWDRNLHLIDRFPATIDNPNGDPPKFWPRYRSIDFGFTNPFVCGWFAQDPDGRLYLYRELYRSKRLVEDLARQILTLSAGEKILYTVADHDAEDRATLEKHGVPTRLAMKDVSPGIQAVQARLAKAGDGKPRLFILRDSLVEPDESLREAKLPVCAEEEFDVYIWQKGIDGKPLKEEPVKFYDHAMDMMRYMVAAFDCKKAYKFDIL